MNFFWSDNNSGVHPNILKGINDANEGIAIPYGDDDITKEAIEKISQAFGQDVDVFFVSTGTAANIIGLTGLLKPYEAVVSTDTGHINVEECGALQVFSGARILYTPHTSGKISKENIKPFLAQKGNEHMSQPKVVYISQTSEEGTIYTVEEIKELADFAHENDMYLHVDGARIANAVVALDSSFKEMIRDTGVDLLSFGGTKNGMMMGEAIISFNKELSKNFKFYRKQGMQLSSKMRYLSAQFIPYFENDLWKENAKKANDMGQYLLERFEEIPAIKPMDNMETNMVFAHIDEDLAGKMKDKYGYELLDPSRNIARFVTSFDTSKEEVDKLIEAIKDLG